MMALLQGARGRGVVLPARLLGVAILVLGACLAPPVHAAGARLRVRDAQQATQAMARLDGDFLDVKEGLYRVTGGTHEPEAALWPTSQVLDGAIAVARLTHAPADLARVRRLIGSLKAFAATPAGVYHARVIPSLRYYDDNNWIALDYLDAYDLLHDSVLLAGAQKIFNWIVTGWDAKHSGGILWADGHYDRPTVSTAPAITIGMRLAAITKQPLYRTWAMRLYVWENSAMRAPSGLYWDHIDEHGSIDRDIVSYNQGAMIDADVAAYKATGQALYLRDGRRIAAAAAAAFSAPWRDRGTSAAFDAIYFQSLAHLNAVSPGAASMAPVRSYVDWAWPTAQASRGDRSEQALLEQAAFVISVAALT